MLSTRKPLVFQECSLAELEVKFSRGVKVRILKLNLIALILMSLLAVASRLCFSNIWIIMINSSVKL
jgi:hypothetical protein